MKSPLSEFKNCAREPFLISGRKATAELVNLHRGGRRRSPRGVLVDLSVATLEPAHAARTHLAHFRPFQSTEILVFDSEGADGVAWRLPGRILCHLSGGSLRSCHADVGNRRRGRRKDGGRGKQTGRTKCEACNRRRFHHVLRSVGSECDTAAADAVPALCALEGAPTLKKIGDDCSGKRRQRILSPRLSEGVPRCP